MVEKMSDETHDEEDSEHPNARNFSAKWLNEDDWNEWATCPHCGDREDDSEELGAEVSKDGKRLTRQCSACGKQYAITLSVTWFWKTEPLLADVRQKTE